MLSGDAHSIFASRGLVRLEQALPSALVREAQAVVRAALEQRGMFSGGAWHFDRSNLQRWPSSNANTLGKKRADFTAAFKTLLTTELFAAVKSLVGERDLVALTQPQLLLTFPNEDRWFVPSSIWHVDVPRLPSADSPGVQTFTFLEASEHEGGGTLVVAGSHRLLNDGRFIRSKDIKRKLKRFPCFKDLMLANAGRETMLGPIGRAEDVEIEVVELTGQPGDVWLMDMRVLHTVAPNARSTPRVMLTQRFAPQSVLNQIMEGFTPTASHLR